MVSHVVLFTPRPDLSRDDRLALLTAFEHAVRAIPTVRGVRLGRRIKHGAAYERQTPEAAEFLVVIDFDDIPALQLYLEHEAHREIGAHFRQFLASALVYDFDLTDIGDLKTAI